MAQQSVYIKNMVCNRCIMVVEQIFRSMEIVPATVGLGHVVLDAELDQQQQEQLQTALLAVGFEMINSRKMRLIEQVKAAVIEAVHRDNNQSRINLSDYITSKINLDYTHLSNLFSEVESTTIEKYFIAQKIERVKELLVYDELTLSQIADMMNYSSSAHLSAQFKKVTGLTPSYFKQIGANKRKPLDKV